MNTTKADFHHLIDSLDDDLAADVLDMVLMQLEPESISDEEYAESVRALAEMRAGATHRWEDVKAELNL